MENVKTMVNEYLLKNNLLTLATVTAEGKPMAHTVSYASENEVIYFVTDKTTRKVANILNQPSVYYTIDKDYEDWGQMEYLQMEGRASVVSDPEEAQKALSLLMQKFPQLSKMEPNPNFIPVKIVPVKGLWGDNKKGFGHKDEVVY